MKSALVVIMFLCTMLSASAQNDNLPEKWTKGFEITYTFGGSMDGSNTSLKFTYDSCVYIRNTAMNPPKTTKFLLTEADRTTILQKMRELRIDKVTSKATMIPVHDGWSSLLCVGNHCMNGGTSAEMSDEHKETFSLAHSWLETFAMGRDKK